MRISFGYMSSKQDADAFLKMIQDYFVAKPIVKKIPQHLMKGMQIKLMKHINTTNNVNPTIYHICKEVDTNNQEEKLIGKLECIFIYPVKSCAAMPITGSWKVVSTGLKFDRQWMVVNSAGVCLTQKQNCRMCLIKPHINTEKDLLILSFPGKSQYCNVFNIIHQKNVSIRGK